MATTLSELPLMNQFYHTPGAENVIIYLHGRGDSIFGLQFLRHYLDLKHFHHLFLNAPDPWPVPVGQGYSWYPMKPDHHEGIARSLGLMGQVLDALQIMKIPSTQVVLLGFSQGAVISMETATNLGRRLMGVIAISGFVYQAEERAKTLKYPLIDTPVLMTHGYQDGVLAFETTKNQAEHLMARMTNFCFKAVSKSHMIVNQELDWFRDFLLATQRGQRFTA